jgi:indolepyruvate ferredoxin oxidoreductase
MGGEGVSWVGASPFTNEKHIFANLGDGTYFHSGYLAIRQSIAAKTNITYKILYNDAVAMTGGQHIDGHLSVAQLTRQLDAEGIKKQVIVTDEIKLLNEEDGIAPGVEIRHRNELDAVQRELREISGVTALIYVQTCASEKRRRRKALGISRRYGCPVQGCGKSYGSDGSLNQHIRLKHPMEFEEFRKYKFSSIIAAG